MAREMIRVGHETKNIWQKVVDGLLCEGDDRNAHWILRRVFNIRYTISSSYLGITRGWCWQTLSRAPESPKSSLDNHAMLCRNVPQEYTPVSFICDCVIILQRTQATVYGLPQQRNRTNSSMFYHRCILVHYQAPNNNFFSGAGPQVTHRAKSHSGKQQQRCVRMAEEANLETQLVSERFLTSDAWSYTSGRLSGDTKGNVHILYTRLLGQGQPAHGVERVE